MIDTGEYIFIQERLAAIDRKIESIENCETENDCNYYDLKEERKKAEKLLKAKRGIYLE